MASIGQAGRQDATQRRAVTQLHQIAFIKQAAFQQRLHLGNRIRRRQFAGPQGPETFNHNGQRHH